MENKAVVVNKDEVALAGKIYYDKFINGGIVIQPSEKSGILIWIHAENIKKVVLMDSTEIIGDGIPNLFTFLENFNEKYKLSEVQ